MVAVDLTRRLAGRVAVITGGGSGIGLAAARRMHAEGARIVIGDIDGRRRRRGRRTTLRFVCPSGCFRRGLR